MNLIIRHRAFHRKRDEKIKLLKEKGGEGLVVLKEHRRRQERTARILLNEEFKAEKLIGKIRLAIFSVFLVQHIVHALVSVKSFTSGVLPTLIAFLFSLGFFVNTHSLGKKKHYEKYEKSFTRFTKYLIITVDVIGISYLFFSLAVGGLVESQKILQYFPNAFLGLGIALLIINVFRFNPLASIYNGILLLFSFAFFYWQLPGITSFQDIFIQGGLRNFSVIQYYIFLPVVTLLSALVARRMRTILLKSKKQDQLERFLPQMVANEVLEGDRDLSMGGKKIKVTILFSDIRNFTTLSESKEPEEVIDFLNSYFNDMITVIFKHNGTLDKIIGDGIMAIYGAPFPGEDDPGNAVLSALDMKKKLKDFNLIQKMKGQKEISIGIGIHTGEVVMGNVGCEQRMEFTAIGDAVNTAARLETLTKNTGESILISSETKNRLNGEFELKELGAFSLKGKKEKVEVFSVLG